MNLIDKDALIEALGIETDCYDCEHETIIYHCDLDPVTVCEKIIQAPVITLTTESAEKAIEVLKNAAWLGAVYSFEETEEAVKTAITALQMVSNQYAEADKKGDLISRRQAVDALNRIARTDNWQAAVSMALLDLPSAQPDIIRCKDCIYYDPPHVENNGVRYEYDEMPADAFDALGTGLVNAEYGINIGGRCCVDYYCKNYSDDKRVFVREDNYCGRAERRTDE